MAQIDLKNAIIRLKDGYGRSHGGSVNNAGGYNSSQTRMNTTFSANKAVEVGDIFTIGANTTEYTVTAHNETSGSAINLDFTPQLGRSVSDDDEITVLPHRLTVKIGEGNLTWSEKKPRQYYKDRGRLDTVRDGDEEPVDVKMDATWEFLKASTGDTPTVEDVLKQRGEASDWVTSAEDPCEPYAVNIEVEYIPPCAGTQKGIITLGDFRYETFDHDLRAGQLSMSGKCNVTEATVVRQDQ